MRITYKDAKKKGPPTLGDIHPGTVFLLNDDIGPSGYLMKTTCIDEINAVCLETGGLFNLACSLVVTVADAELVVTQ